TRARCSVRSRAPGPWTGMPRVVTVAGPAPRCPGYATVFDGPKAVPSRADGGQGETTSKSLHAVGLRRIIAVVSVVLAAGVGATCQYGATNIGRYCDNPGNELLLGGDGNDLILANSCVEQGCGEDRYIALASTLDGGPGDDRLTGGDANDKLIGGPGNDSLA